MPRRRPRPRPRRTGELPGVPRRVAYELDRLGDPRLESGAVAVDFRTWIRMCRMPAAVLRRDGNDWIEFIGPIARDGLERAIGALPRRRARALRSAVHAWDEILLTKVGPGPADDGSGAWWWRLSGW